MLLFFASLLCLSASALLYLGSPNQQWLLASPINAKQACLVSLLLNVVAGYLVQFEFSLLSSIFTVITLNMLCLSVLPLVTRFDQPGRAKRQRWWRLQRQDDHHRHTSQWIGKTVGALLIGFPLALFLSGLIGFTVAIDAPLDVRSQLMMWLIVPIWLLPVSLIYLSKNPYRLFTLLIVLTVSLTFILNLVISRN